MTRRPFDENELPLDLQDILELAGRQENGVPKGLARCPVCGDWRGHCLWPDPLLWHEGPTRVSCRCEANICKECGEPIHEYKLGSNVYSEATGEISHVPGMVGASHRCGGPRIELPWPIEPDWDDKYAPVLAGFPVTLVYIGVRPRNDETGKPIVVKARYDFDPGSFLLVTDRKQMRYHSCEPSDYFVDVIWYPCHDRWETYKYKAGSLLHYTAGENFEEAMKNALRIGLDPDEPAS